MSQTRNHPDVHLPWSEWSEDQTLHVAVAYSNPFRWRSRRKLFNAFRRHMEHSPNVILHVGEIAYGNRPFEVTTSHNPLDIQLRSNTILWHKENLLNAVISRFPADWQYGAILDGDFHMSRHDWALESIHQLQHHPLVQVFSSYACLSHEHRPFRLSSSFAYNYVNHCGTFNAHKRKGYGYYPGAPGGGWAFTHGAFDLIGGLLDVCILGSGDWHMAFGLIGQETEMDKFHPDYIKPIRDWQQEAVTHIKGNIGYVENHAIHHFHGSFSNRGYGDRNHILVKHKFQPGLHLKRDHQGLYTFTSLTPMKLQEEIRQYFVSRNEDDPSLYGREKELI